MRHLDDRDGARGPASRALGVLEHPAATASDPSQPSRTLGREECDVSRSADTGEVGRRTGTTGAPEDEDERSSTNRAEVSE